MTTLPLIRDTVPGIYQVCTTANTDYAITVPDGAVGCILWFETSASDATIIRGRIGLDQADTAVTGITSTSTNLGYHPPMPVEYELGTRRFNRDSRTVTRDHAYIHVASATAGSVVRGMWLYATDRA